MVWKLFPLLGGITLEPLSLNVHMLGGFSLTVGDREISDSDNRSYKVWLLLAYLLYCRSRPLTQDELTGLLWGESESCSNPANALKTMGFLPDDRKADGCIADLSVRENIILALQSRQGIFRTLPKAKQDELADQFIDLLQIKTASRETPLSQLSGGNQQKVILARWLCTHPDFLILDEPTRGIDIGTKTEFQKLVLKFAAEGMSVVFISSEIEEMLRTCSRMCVMRDGNKVGEIEGEMTQESVMGAIAGGDKE